jgi:hypothetical protein
MAHAGNDREAWPDANYAQALRDLAPQFGDEPVAGVLRDAADTIDERSKLAEARGAKYHELIMAVSMVHPGETRHQTALRYIVKAEQPGDNAGTAQANQSVGGPIDTKEGE